MSRTATVKFGCGHVNLAVLLRQFFVVALLLCLSAQSALAVTDPTQQNQNLTDEDLFNGVIIWTPTGNWGLGNYRYNNALGHLELGLSRGSGTLRVHNGKTFSFDSGVATVDGGAIYVHSGKNYNFRAMTVDSNNSTSSGYIVFNNNTTDKNGGAIFVDNAAQLTLQGYNSTSGNPAFFDTETYRKFITFTNNHTTGNERDTNYRGGGAIYNDGGTIDILNVQFGLGTGSGNTTTMAGGAIYNNKGTLNFATGEPQVNHLDMPLDISDGWSIPDNSGIFGPGGTALEFAASANVFNYNEATLSGGAIYNNEGTLDFTAQSDAGETYSITINTTAGNAHTDRLGWGLTQNQKAESHAGSFRRNSTNDSGGAIYNNNGTMSFAANALANDSLGNTITSTTAPGHQDYGVSLNNTSTVISESIGGYFFENQAQRYGGAIYHVAPSSKPMTFDATAAPTLSTARTNANNGGTQSTNTFTVTMNTDARGGDFTRNQASLSGGGIYNSGGTLEFTAGAVHAEATATAVSNSDAPNDQRRVSTATTTANANSSTKGGTFNENTVAENGGAIYNQTGTLAFSAEGATATARVTAEARTNATQQSLGATSRSIANANATATAIGGEFDGNIAGDSDRDRVWDSGGLGGAIYNEGGTLTVDVPTMAVVTETYLNFATGANIYSNAHVEATATAVAKVYGAVFNENEAGAGGAIYNKGGTLNFVTADTVTTTATGLLESTDNADMEIAAGGTPNPNSNIIFEPTFTQIVTSPYYQATNRYYDVGIGTSTSDVAAGLFTFNKARAGSGGAIYNAIGESGGIGTANFTGISRFVGNWATVDGGAIFNEGRKNANVTGGVLNFTANASGYTTFSGNGAEWSSWSNQVPIPPPTMIHTQRGGAIFNSAGGLLTMTGTNLAASLDRFGYFYNNRAVLTGGAIFNAEEGVANLTNIYFERNEAGQGGAIYNDGGILTLVSTNSPTTRSVFSYNKATTGAGGAIYFGKGTVAPTVSKSLDLMGHLDGTAHDFLFEFNEAQTYGGAIYIESPGILNINTLHFVSNAADAGGGAIWNAGTGNIVSSTFQQNSDHRVGLAAGNGKGGALYNLGSLYLANNTFKSNTVNGITGRGGAIYNEGTISHGRRDASGNIIVDTNGDPVDRASNNTFTENKASWGGAIYNDNGTIELAGGSFDKNTAQQGGAIYIDGGSVNLDLVNFTQNQTSLDPSNTVTSADGAAIYNDGGILTLIDTNFTNNRAEQGVGGAIYNAGGTINLEVTTSSTFQDNRRDFTSMGWGTHNYESIYFAGTGNVLNITNNGTLNMYDPMSWESGAGVDITHNGTGTWNLMGKSGFASGTGTVNVDIQEGTLYLKKNSFNYGTTATPNDVGVSAKLDLGNGTFTLASGATMMVDGAVLNKSTLVPPLTTAPALTDLDGSSITTTGNINLGAGSELVFNNITEWDYIRSAQGNDGILTLAGSNVKVDSSIRVHLVTTLGQDSDFTTAGVQQLDWFDYLDLQNGKLRLFATATPGTNVVDELTWVNENGVTEVWTEERLNGSVSSPTVIDGYLQKGAAQAKVLNDLQWTGAVDSIWDTGTKNWYGNSGTGGVNGTTYSYTFYTNDAVIFDNSYIEDKNNDGIGESHNVAPGRRHITLAGNTQTGGMDVRGNDYVFDIAAGQVLSAVVDPGNPNAIAGSINFGSATVNLQGTNATVTASRDITFGDGSTLTMTNDSTVHAENDLIFNGTVNIGTIANAITSGTTLTADREFDFTGSTTNFVFDLTGATVGNAVLTLDGNIDIAAGGVAGNGNIDVYNRDKTLPNGYDSPITLIDTNTVGGVTDTGTLLVNGVATPPTRGTSGQMTGLGLSADKTDLLLLTVNANGKASDLYWKGSTTSTGSNWDETNANWTGTVNGIRVKTFLESDDDVYFANNADNAPVLSKTVKPTMNVTMNSMHVLDSGYIFDVKDGNITSKTTIDFGNGSTIVSDVNTTITAENGGIINFGTGTIFDFDLSGAYDGDVILTLDGTITGEKIGSGRIDVRHVNNLAIGESVVLVDTDTAGSTVATGNLYLDNDPYTVPGRVIGGIMYALDTADNNKQLLLLAVDAGMNTTDSAPLTWTGSNGSTWNTADINWIGLVGNAPVYTFLDKDAVLFNDTASAANRDVVLAQDVAVDSMSVTSSGYTFNLTNGGIESINDINLRDSTVIVTLQEDSEGLFTATNTITSGGEIALRGTTIEVNASAIKAEVFRDGEDILVMKATDGFGMGSWVNEEVYMGPNNSNPLFVGKFYLDWTKNEGYVRLGLFDFNDTARIWHHNTTEAVEALNVLRYAKWEDEQWQSIMRNPEAAIHQLRGTELVGNALAAALWNPWEITHRRMRTTRDDSGWNTWGEGFYRTGHTSSDDNAVSYDASRGGTMIGADFGANRYWHLGGSFGYSLPSIENEFGKVEGDDLTVGFYSKINFFDTAAVTTYFGYGYQGYEMERHDFTGTHKGDFNGDALYASVEFAKPIQSQWGLILPLVALDHQTAWTKKFIETGNSAWNQAVSGASMERTMLRFGVDGKWQSAGSLALMSRMQAGILLSGDEYATVVSHFPGSMGSMSLRGVDIGALQVNAGISATGEYRQRYNWFFDLDGYLTNQSYAVQGQLGLSTRW